MVTIVEKIQKLLALSESPNEHEAKTAMLKAQELMVKHKITMKDVQKEVKQDVVITTTHQRFKNTKWKAILAKVISDNFLCEALTSQNSSNHVCRVSFIGHEEDVDICIAVYNYAIKFVDKNVARLRRARYDEGKSAKGIEEAYAVGFCHGLRENYMAQIRNNTEFGLVLVKDPDVKDALAKLNPVTRDVKMKPNPNAMEGVLGYMDGRSFSMTDRLEGQVNEQFT